jgi:hypothetical protein
LERIAELSVFYGANAEMEELRKRGKRFSTDTLIRVINEFEQERQRDLERFLHSFLFHVLELTWNVGQ